MKEKLEKYKERVGEVYDTKEDYQIRIISYRGCANCDIVFEHDNSIVLYNQDYYYIKGGAIPNPYHRTVFGVGYLGQGKHKTWINGEHTKVYEVWMSMFRRCYSKDSLKKNPTYKDVTVCKEWHNFQVFGDWFEDNYIEGWQLDKDILVKNNRVYNPENCCFVPHEINSLFVKSDKARGEYPVGITYNKKNNSFIARVGNGGNRKYLGSFKTIEEAFQAYKTAKEAWIKEVANKWRGLISDQVYQAMHNYQVELTD